MLNKINVLVFPAGEINSIELHDALAYCININLFGASSIERHGEYVFKNYISNVPLINSTNFILEFNKIIEKYKIDVIFPTHDAVAEYFSKNQDIINAKIIVASPETAKICRDKKLTYDHFKDYDFVPKIYSEIKEFPVFIKPRTSQGAVGAILVKERNNLPLNFNFTNHIISEYLPGDEYTVDCLTNKAGELLVVSPRSRKRLLAGVSVSGSVEELSDEIRYIAVSINKRLSFLGLWWFQIKKDKNEKWKLLEISTRTAGNMCLTRARGINLPLLSVYIAMGYDIEIKPNIYQVHVDRTLVSRYKINYKYDKVYLDLDDTVIIDEKVNLNLIRFIYQCSNQKVKVILISKHPQKNIINTLNHFKISKKLFDKVIHIKNNQNKFSFIESDKAIFIDNSFKERMEVYNHLHIPVFDVDGVEVLLNWKS